jgi:hypothetical protein
MTKPWYEAILAEIYDKESFTLKPATETGA